MNLTNPRMITSVKLGEVCRFKGGSGFREALQGSKSGQYPFIKVSDMELLCNRKYIVDANNWIDKKTLVRESITIFPVHSVVFAKVGAALLLNRRRILTRETAIDNNMMGAIPEKIEPDFLFYVLLNIDFSNFVQSGAVPSINQAQISNIETILPCSAEQTQIATILSTIDRAIEQTEALIAKQQRIKTGLMQDLLTKGIDENGNIRSEETHEFKDSPLGRIPVEWEVKKIEQKLERIIDYRGQTPKKVTEGIPLLTAKNVRDGFIEKEPQEFIADSAYNSWMSRGIPEVGDVLFTTEAPMGNVASIPNYRIALAQRLLTLCPKINELSQDFLFWILHWKRSKERIELLTSGSTVVGIKQSVFRKVIFAFPSYNEQERIYAVLNSHDEINKNEKHKLKKLQRLKTGLMQDLLTGKVRVTDLLNQKTATN